MRLVLSLMLFVLSSCASSTEQARPQDNGVFISCVPVSCETARVQDPHDSRPSLRDQIGMRIESVLSAFGAPVFMIFAPGEIDLVYSGVDSPAFLVSIDATTGRVDHIHAGSWIADPQGASALRRDLRHAGPLEVSIGSTRDEALNQFAAAAEHLNEGLRFDQLVGRIGPPDEVKIDFAKSEAYLVYRWLRRFGATFFVDLKSGLVTSGVDAEGFPVCQQ